MIYEVYTDIVEHFLKTVGRARVFFGRGSGACGVIVRYKDSRRFSAYRRLEHFPRQHRSKV